MCPTQDITYSVPSLMDKTKEAVLLKNVTGVLESGQMTALVRSARAGVAVAAPAQLHCAELGPG